MNQKKHNHNLKESKNDVFEFSQLSLNQLQLKLKNNYLSLKQKKAQKYNHYYGLNKLEEHSKLNWIKKMLSSIFSFFNILLMAIIAIQIINYFFLADGTEKKTILIIIVFVSAMIFLSSFTEFINYFKYFKINSRLTKTIDNKIYCLRNVDFKKLNLNNQDEILKHAKLINFDDIALYDLIYFTRGSVLPGDIKICFSNQLKVNQANISGEFKPIIKNHYLNKTGRQKNLMSINNIIFANSIVSNGYGLGIVINRFKTSIIGDINQKIIKIEKKSFFDHQFQKIVKFLFYGVLFFSAIVFTILSLIKIDSYKNNVIEILIFAFAVGLSLIPESLPMIISANMAIGSKQLAKKGMILKNSKAIQSLGCVKTLFVDKTGTLTKNKMIFKKCVDCNLNNQDEILKLGYLNSKFQVGLELNNSVDLEIITQFQKNNSVNITNFKKLDEIPFNFKTRLISILYQDRNTKKNFVSIKGSFLEVFNLCKFVEINSKKILLTPEIKNKVFQNYQKIQLQANKIIALCYQDNVKYNLFESNFLKSKNNLLVFKGFILFNDEIQPNVAHVLKKLKNNFNVETKILSGDDYKIIASIAQKIDFKIKGAISGQELRNLKNINDINVFYKIDPFQKQEIIKIQQKQNNSIGFLGDGINDALALKESDSSISVESGSEIAKKSSDIILTKKDLNIIVDGFKQGRKVNLNIIKYLKLTISNKFSLAGIYFLSILILELFKIDTTILSPVQILFLDFMFDLTQSVVIFDNVEKNSLKFIQKIKLRNIFSFVVFNSSIMILAFLLNFILTIVIAPLLQTGIDIKSNSFKDILHTTAFLEIGIVFLLSLFILRTKHFVLKKETFPPLIMVLGILGVLALVLLAPLLSLSGSKSINFLNLVLFPGYIKFCYLFILLSVIFYWGFEEIIKKLYLLRYKKWF